MAIKTLEDFRKALSQELAARGYNSTVTSNPPKTGKEAMQKRLFITPRPGPVAPLQPPSSAAETKAEDQTLDSQEEE